MVGTLCLCSKSIKSIILMCLYAPNLMKNSSICTYIAYPFIKKTECLYAFLYECVLEDLAVCWTLMDLLSLKLLINPKKFLFNLMEDTFTLSFPR